MRSRERMMIRLGLGADEPIAAYRAGQRAGVGRSRYLGAVLTGIPKPTPRSGYSLVELFFVVSLLGILLLIALPRMNRGLTSSRVDRAATIVALTLERAFTLASRQRRPVVVACDCPNRALEVRDLTSGDVYLRRALGPETEFEVDSLTLWVLGGVATLRGEAPTPAADLRIAGVGPAVSIALGLAAAGAAIGLEAAGVSGLAVAILGWLAGINLVLGVFNLIPAAPLDGGRILRAALWAWRGDRGFAAIVPIPSLSAAP